MTYEKYERRARAIKRRAEIIGMIDENTVYDASSVRFHRNGTISALKDANKTFGSDSTRYLICHLSDFDDKANPFRA